MITINKIKKCNIELPQLQKEYMNMNELDSYEKMMLYDYYSLNSTESVNDCVNRQD